MEQMVAMVERELAIELERIRRERHAVLRYERMIAAIQLGIEKLRKVIRVDGFPDRGSEILYFRKLAPRIYSQLFYYQKIHRLELYRHYSSTETLIQIMEHETYSFSIFFCRYSEFINYYHSETTYRDVELFTRGGRKDMTWQGQEIEAVIDDDFCLGAYLGSCIICNGLYRDWLAESLKEMKDPGWKERQGRKLPGLKWEASGTDVVEQIYAWWLSKTFGDVPLKKIVEEVEDWLGMDLKNHAITWQEIKRRKKVRAKFMGGLVDNLVGKMEAGD